MWYGQAALQEVNTLNGTITYVHEGESIDLFDIFLLGRKLTIAPSNLSFTLFEGVDVLSYRSKFHMNIYFKRHTISKLEFSNAFSLRGVKVAPFELPPKSWNFQNVISYNLAIHTL